MIEYRNECQIVFGGDCFGQFASDFDDHLSEFDEHSSEFDDHLSEFNDHSSKSVTIFQKHSSGNTG